MKIKFTIYIILLMSTIASLFYLTGISFFMFFGKRRNIEIETAIDNQLKINYSIIFLIIILIIFLINRIQNLKMLNKQKLSERSEKPCDFAVKTNLKLRFHNKLHNFF